MKCRKNNFTVKIRNCRNVFNIVNIAMRIVLYCHVYCILVVSFIFISIVVMCSTVFTARFSANDKLCSINSKPKYN